MKKWRLDQFRSLVNLESFSTFQIDANEDKSIFLVYGTHIMNPELRKVLGLFVSLQEADEYIKSIYDFLVEE